MQESASTDPSECRGGATARLGRHDVHKGFGGIRELLHEHRTWHTVGKIQSQSRAAEEKQLRQALVLKDEPSGQPFSKSPIRTGAHLPATQVSVRSMLPATQVSVCSMREL